MEHNNSVAGRQEAGPQNEGENNHEGAVVGGPSGVAAVVAAAGPSGVAHAGVPSGVGAGAGPSQFAALDILAALAVAGGPIGYTASGPGGFAAAAGVPSGVAGPSSESARGKGKRNHRHSAYQINAMEDYFKNVPHPNALQRNQLAMSLGLDDTQVKCWFQNKRTQIKNQGDMEENDALQIENNALQARKQQLIEAMRKNTCMQCSVGSSSKAKERNNLILENSRLTKEVESLKSTIVGFTAGQNQQNPRYLSIIPHNQQNLHITLNDPQNLSIIYENPQNLPLESNPANENPYRVDLGQGHASTSITSFEDVVHSIKVPASHDFRQSLNELVALAAEEFKLMSMFGESLWICCSADGATSVLNEVEYHSTLPDIFGPIRLGYTCEASRHTIRISMSPTKLLNILMDVNEWAFTFSDIVSKAVTILDLPSDGINHNAALKVMAAEYHIPTPLVPNRRTCFARYCTQQCEGVWAVVDVSVDKILHTPENITCQKRPSGCLIQEMADGTSKIAWIEHVFVDYTGVSTLFKCLIRSGLGFGAKRWVSILERQCQRFVSANVPSTTHDFNNQVMLSPEGRRGILMISERMMNYFIIGISGPRSGRWTEVNGNFGDDIRLMSTRVMDDPGLPNGTLLSVTTSFWLSLAPNMVFNFLRDHKYRNKWDICGYGNEYEPVCSISYGEEAKNCISIYKVMRRQGHILQLQESWSGLVSSHVVFASTEIRNIDVILGGGDLNGLPLLPFGFTILPDGPSSRRDGSSGTLLTVSFQVLVSESPMADIDIVATTKVTQFLRCHCEKIKHALGAVGPIPQLEYV